VVLRRYDAPQIKQLRAMLDPAAIAGVAQSSVYRALGQCCGAATRLARTLWVSGRLGVRVTVTLADPLPVGGCLAMS